MFSETFHALRRQRGLSQEQLAEQLHVSRQAVSKWEQGTSLPESEKLLAISRYFDVSVDFLVGEGSTSSSAPEMEKPEPSLVQEKKEALPHKKAGRYAGLCAALTGALGLLLWGVIAVCSPAVSEKLSESSVIRIDGSGIFLMLCAAVMVIGAVLLFRNAE